MPLLGDSEAPRFFWSRWIPSSWGMVRACRKMEDLARSLPWEGVSPRTLLGGPGWIVLPHDPAPALSMLPFALRLLRVLPEGSGLAVSAATRAWLPPLDLPLLDLAAAAVEPEVWARGCADSRRAWAIDLARPAAPATVAAVRWLGVEQRISLVPSAVPGLANVDLPPASAAGSREEARSELCARLRLALPALEPVRRRPGRSVVLELPDGITRRGASGWVRLASELAAAHPLVVVHRGELVAELHAGLQGLGNRLTTLRIGVPADILRLAAEARVWVGPEGPAALLASWQECPLVVFARRPDPELGWGPAGEPAVAFVRTLRASRPGGSEVLAAVLDLTPHGM